MIQPKAFKYSYLGIVERFINKRNWLLTGIVLSLGSELYNALNWKENSFDVGFKFFCCFALVWFGFEIRKFYLKSFRIIRLNKIEIAKPTNDMFCKLVAFTVLELLKLKTTVR